MERVLTIKRLIMLFFMVASGWVFGQERDFVADTQKFGVRLFLVPDADAFVAQWSKPQTPKLTSFDKAPVNSQFAGAVLYWGGGADAKGECHIQLRVQMLNGNRVLASGPEMPLCQGHAPPPSGVLALSDTMIDLFTPKEPANLVVLVTVTDQVNKETLSVKAPITVFAE